MYLDQTKLTFKSMHFDIFSSLLQYLQLIAKQFPAKMDSSFLIKNIYQQAELVLFQNKSSSGPYYQNMHLKVMKLEPETTTIKGFESINFKAGADLRGGGGGADAPLLRDSTPCRPKGNWYFFSTPFLADQPENFSKGAFGANMY